LARDAKVILVSRGKKLLEFDSSASDDELANVILGRSGTLRAPAIRAGDTFIVGYSEDGYRRVFP
jgi:arsenate reductase-like glutaredoxin family protein